MKVMIIASWEDQSKLPELATKVAPTFMNPPAGIKRLVSYGAMGGNSVFSVYDVEDSIALTKYVTLLAAGGFTTEVFPVIETEVGLKAVLEVAKSIKVS